MGVQLRRLGPNTQTKALPLTENEDYTWIAGRGSYCDIITRSKYASRKHFSLIYKGKNFYICDHGSANGTFVNDERIQPHQEYPINLGSIISVGVLTAYQNESDCVVYVFEVCKEKSKSNEVEDPVPQNCNLESNKKVATKENEMVCNSNMGQEPDCRNIIIKTEPGCSNILENSPNVIDCDKGSEINKIKTEKIDITYTNSNSPNLPSVNLQNGNLDIFHEGLIKPVEFSENKVNIKCKTLEGFDGHSSKNSEVNHEDEEMKLPEAGGLADDEAMCAFEPSTRVDEENRSNFQQPYSVTEELIEISDSDDDLTRVQNIKREIDDLNFTKRENDSDEDIIFVENVVNSKDRDETDVPRTRIKRENDDDDFTETDMKWVGKLFKTKEECDSFIQSQRESNEDICEEDDEKWMELITNCADEIGQILLTEGERVKMDQHRIDRPRVVEDDLLNLRVEDQIEPLPSFGGKIDLNNDQSTVIGLLTYLPGNDNSSSLVPTVCQSSSSRKGKRPNFISDEKEAREKPKKIKLVDPFADDDIANLLEPLKKKSKLDGHVKKKEGRSPRKSGKTKGFRKTETVRALLKEISKNKRKKIGFGLPSAEKEKIKDQRKLKLRELSMREASKQEKKDTAPKTMPPLKVKITRKNRSEFLCEGLQGIKEESGDNNISSKQADKADQKFPSPQSCSEPKELKNRSRNSMQQKKPIVSKKSVRFEGNHSIRYYQTENRISRKTSSLPQYSSEPATPVQGVMKQFRSVLHSVCSWNTLWLEESKKAQIGVLPPPFHSDKLKNIQKKFANHGDYVKSFIPLLLLELWHVVSEKWKTVTTTCRFPAACLSYEEPFEGSNLGLIKCESLVQSKNDFSSMIKEGDLVLFTFHNKTAVQQNDGDSQTDSKKSGYRFFGFVDKKIVEIISPQEDKDASGGKTSDFDISKILKMDILAKSRPVFRDNLENTVQITIVSNITPQLIHCQAVCKLQQSPLCPVILSPNRPDMTLSPPLKKERIIFKGPLDKSQEELILRLLSSCISRDNNLLLIQGGPGTGKTHIIVALILQLLSTKQWKGPTRPKILYCSHSNLVVDELALKLRNYRKTLSSDSRYKLVRYGNINSINPSVRDISCHQLAMQNEHSSNVMKKVKVLDDKIKLLAEELEIFGNCQQSEVEQKSAKLHEYVKNREIIRHSRPVVTLGQKPSKSAEENILENADVICATCISCSSSRMITSFQKIRSKSADQKIICIVDEAMQCRESETIVPLGLGVTHLILVGDAQQLRPTVRNETAQSLGINQSLFWRILSIFDKAKTTSPVFTLKTQYRMNRLISFIPNKIFYQNYLIDGCQQETESKLEECLMLMDLVSNSDTDNECEARIHRLAENVCREIINIFGSPGNCSIGIITCLLDQAKSLRSKLAQKFDESIMTNIDVNSIENSQGREYDIVLFLFDANMQCGFRANVAMTRARLSLMILTSSRPSYKNNKLLSKLVEETTARHAFFYVSPDVDGQFLKMIISKTSDKKSL
ncbi:UNVERIFIED_CONTAM: hypothetical protein PYX00_003254 [Menopon gallinae]|uniref:FHA domain-containing protein n=1 Tax=Menopon gallinae TaxID=328185 RepID=A0AAW2HZB0_9NEOP